MTLAGQERGNARARMVRDLLNGRHAAIAWVDYKGRRYEVEVPVHPGESEAIVLEAALHEVIRKARAARITDFFTGERIN